MPTVDQLERAARYEAGELSASDAQAFEAELAREPLLAEALRRIRALAQVTAELPIATLAPEKVEHLVQHALKAPVPRRWLPVAMAAGVVFAAAAAFLLRPQTVLTIAAGTAVVDGRTLTAGESVTGPDRAAIATDGVAVVRIASSGTLLCAPRSELAFDREPELLRGAAVLEGDVALRAGEYRVVVSGKAVVSREPLEGDFRETPKLTAEELLDKRRIRWAAAAAAAAGGLLVYALSGEARIEAARGTGGAVTVRAPGAWASSGRTAARSTDANAPRGDPSPPVVEEPMVAADGSLEVRVVSEGKPVAGAAVVLYVRGSYDSAADRQAWPVAGNAQTDAAGTARLAARPGSYALSIRASGHPVTRRTVLRPSGEAVTVLNVTLDAPLSLAGVTEDARTHKPVAPAVVRAQPRGMPEAEAVTADIGADGRFVLSGLTAGYWKIEGDAPGFGSAEPLWMSVPSFGPARLVFRAGGFLEGRIALPDGGPAAGAAVLVTGERSISLEASATGTFSTEVPVGEWVVNARRDALLGRSGERTVRAGETVSVGTVLLGAGARLTGKVSSDGSPVAGAAVSVSPHGGAGDLGRAFSGPDGVYSVALPPGLYDVEVEAPGYGADPLTGITVGEGETRADLPLARNGSVRGVVTDAADGGVAGLIAVLGPVSRRGPSPQAHVLGPDGTFGFSDVRPGDWVVSVTREGETIGARSLITVEPGKQTEVSLALRPPARISGELTWRCSGPARAVDVTFARPSARGRPDRVQVPAGEKEFRVAVAPGTYSIFATVGSDGRCIRPTGRPVEVASDAELKVSLVLEENAPGLTVYVAEADGRPAAGAMVTLRTGPAPEQLLSIGDADADGMWQTAGQLQAVPLTVLASRKGGFAQLDGIKPGTTTVRLRLSPPASLVVAIEGAPPQARSTMEMVTVPSFAWQDVVVTTTQSFTLGEVPAARLHLTVRSEGGLTGSGEVVTHAGERSRVSIKLEPGGTIRGRLVDTAGAPMSGWVTVLNTQGEEVSEGTPVADSGRFEIAPVPAGAWLLRAMGGARFVLRPLPVQVRSGQVTELGDVKVHTVH